MNPPAKPASPSLLEHACARLLEAQEGRTKAELALRGAKAQVCVAFREARRAGGITLQQVAEHAGVATSSVCDMEHGRRPLPESMIDALRGLISLATDRP